MFSREGTFLKHKTRKKILTCLFTFLKWIPVKSFKTVWWFYPLDPGNLCQSHPDLWELVNVFVCIRYILIFYVYFSALLPTHYLWISFSFSSDLCISIYILAIPPSGYPHKYKHTSSFTDCAKIYVCTTHSSSYAFTTHRHMSMNTTSMLFCIFQLSKLKNSTLLFPLHPICFTACFLF